MPETDKELMLIFPVIDMLRTFPIFIERTKFNVNVSLRSAYILSGEAMNDISKPTFYSDMEEDDKLPVKFNITTLNIQLSLKQFLFS